MTSSWSNCQFNYGKILKFWKFFKIFWNLARILPKLVLVGHLGILFAWASHWASGHLVCLGISLGISFDIWASLWASCLLGHLIGHLGILFTWASCFKIFEKFQKNNFKFFWKFWNFKKIKILKFFKKFFSKFCHF